jgi:hypothetical protein
MTRLLISLALVAALTGCSTPSGDNESLITQIQAATKKACLFVPTVATVSALIKAFGLEGGGAAGLASTSELATKICAAVSGPTQFSEGKPVLNGVPIEGEFVKK